MQNASQPSPANAAANASSSWCPPTNGQRVATAMTWIVAAATGQDYRPRRNRITHKRAPPPASELGNAYSSGRRGRKRIVVGDEYRLRTRISMFNATRNYSPTQGDGRHATRFSARRWLRSRMARTASLAVPIAASALSISLGSTAALAAGSPPDRQAAVTSVTWHNLNLLNGWKSSQSTWNTGNPSYAISGGVVYLSASLKGGTVSDFSLLPVGARPAHIIYRGTYTLQGAFGEVYFEPTGFAAAAVTSASKVYTSLAGISFPISTVSQHKLTLLNGWKSGDTPFGTGPFSYAIKGGIVYLSGGIKQPSGTNGLVAILPTAARPTHNLWITVYTSSSTAGTLHIRPNGQVIVGTALDPSAARTITSLGAIPYPHHS